MKRNALLLALLLGAAPVQTSPALSGSQAEDPKPAASEPHGEMKDAQPADEHELLDVTVGEWTYTMTIWPFTGMKPEKTTGEAESEWVLGRRFVRQVVRGEIGGEPFEGIGYTGYDRQAEKYSAIWMDTRGTAALTGSGDHDADSESITLKGEFVRAGLERPFKMVLKLDSQDAYTVEMWVPGAYEQLFKNYEVAYTRKK